MDVIMPQLGETVAEGVVTKWYKKVGDAVKADEVLFDVETDKVSTEIPAQATGVVAEILVQEGVTAKVGERLAVIRESQAAAAAPTTAPLAAAISADGTGAQRISPTAAHASEIAKPPLVPSEGAQARLSPVVRKLMSEHALSPGEIQGTGRDGRITREDVTSHVAKRGEQPESRTMPPVTPVTRAPQTPSERIEPTAPSALKPALTGSPGQVLPLNAVRKRVAENMTRSWTTVPHVLQVVEADFFRVEQARRELGAAWKEREGHSLTYLPFVVRALSIALGRYPKLNSTFGSDTITVQRRINIGIAVDMNFEGLMVPVVKDVPNKSLPQLAREINDLAGRARAGKLKPDELTEGTYTITNNGAYSTVITAPIINQPQVAILSTDAVRKKPVVIESPEGDSIAVRPVGVLAQSFDHRAVDGAYAAAFLRELKLIIETRSWSQDLQS
ncbi:MAG: Dihydrolipoamide acetyltransferase component of pyruvate dehydrogenase complex [Betaproteobacteria bacterium]|nr:Dihydrolipoamide acetyltransferase component of pyruvate dehydrogenase complex [Betaproteobacteria bacterium]